MPDTPKRHDPTPAEPSKPAQSNADAPATPAEEQPAPLVTRVLLLPVGADRETVAFFGVPVASADVLINYHDLAKVRVRATEAALADLESQAAAHFEEG